MPYEQGVERRDVAIRSLYRMWQRGRKLRPHLYAFGLTEDDLTTAFQDQPFPRTEALVFETIRRCPAVLVAAEKLLADYIWFEAESRREHYTGDKDEPHF